MQFNWLHLTDLHCGMQVQQWLGQNVVERVIEDFAYLHPRTCPWDLILFTGDLTNRGTAEQFTEADTLLTRLRTWIAEHQGGRQPILLAVPGNHDLQRPQEDDEGLNSLKDWATSPGTQQNFWHKPGSKVRKTVTAAFRDYSAWWDRQVATAAAQPNGIRDYHTGLLPGDFSATIENESGCRLGVLGLNTAFLQLTGDDYDGRLAIHARQFHVACGGDGPAWARGHNACLLLTHHPAEWLDNDSQQHLIGQITDHGRFALHLCGHLHEARSVLTAIDFTKPKLLFQGRSLFGLETYGDKQERLHGYAAGSIVLNSDPGGIVFWPRAAIRRGKELDLDRDPNQKLRKGQDHTEPYRFALARPCTLAIHSGGGPGQRREDPNFNRALGATIDKTLAAPAAASLREALRARLFGPGGTIGERLCALSEQAAVGVQVGAVTDCLKQAPRGDTSRDLRAISRQLLGWLLMRFVREEWCAAERHTSSTQLASVRVEVGSEVGAEVLWARWQGESHPPDFRVIGRRVLGLRNVLGGTSLPEEGWEDWTRYLDDAKAALWVAMFGDKPPATFRESEDRRLRDAFKFDCDVYRGARYYLTVRDQDVWEPLAQPDLLTALRQDLGLQVLFVAKGPEDRFFSIGETRLQDLIKQCLKTLKDHGDD